MGFKAEFNTIIRTDDIPNPEVGKVYDFEKEGSRIFTDNIQIWLTRQDWTALAEIQVIEQTRKDGVTKGKFEVKYVYDEEEQKVLTEIFKRMYGWA